MHLKLKCDQLLSDFAVNFNLRRYTMGAVVNLQGIVEELETKLQAAMKRPQGNGGRGGGETAAGGGQGLTLVHFSAQLKPCLTHKNTLHTIHTP